MNVLHTEASMNWGGKQLRIVEQAQWLNDRGYESWIAARPHSSILEEAERRKLPCIALPFKGKTDLTTLSGLHGLMRKRNIDIIDCHGSRDAMSCAKLRMLGLKIVRSQHVDSLKDRFSQRLLWRYGSDRIIVVSEAVKHRVIDMGAPIEKIDIVNEGIDFSEFDAASCGKKIRAEFGIPAESLVLTNIGMIRPDKGQRYFVEAAAEIVKALGPNVYFMIVGSPTRPDFQHELQRSIDASPHREKIILTGYRSDVAAFIAASDCMVISSLMDAHSRVVPQAFAMKKPVVATAVGGIPEFVKNGETGMLVKSADARALARGVIESVRARNAALIDNAYQMAQQRFSMETMMRQTLNSYAKAIAGKQRELCESAKYQF